MIGALSPKQEDFITHSTAFVNISEGSVRSGKTIAADWRWLDFMDEGPRGALYLLTGKTQDTVVRNILSPMQQMFGASRVSWTLGQNATARIMGKTCAIVGANDKSSETRIRGGTFWGWYADEITLHPQNFVDMALTRLSAPDAKAFWTCNPDSPYHWVKTDYLDDRAKIAEGYVRHWHFTLDDNPYLPDAYVAALKSMFSGLFYRRMIDGEWVLAEGVIYDMFRDDLHRVLTAELLAKHDLAGFPRFFVSCDHGVSAPCVFLLYGQFQVLGKPHFHGVAEWYWDSQKTRKQKTDAEYAESMGLWLAGVSEELCIPKIIPATVWVDPAAAGFKKALRRKNFRVLNATNDVLEGIGTVSSALSELRLTYDPACKNVAREKAAYIWDEKAQLRGEDKPLKSNDHASDAERYGVHSETRRPQGAVIRR